MKHTHTHTHTIRILSRLMVKVYTDHSDPSEFGTEDSQLKPVEQQRPSQRFWVVVSWAVTLPFYHHVIILKETLALDSS